MSPEEDALRRLVEILDRHVVPYMVTGSVATSFHGRPRATHDADIIIDPTVRQLELLVHDLDAAGRRQRVDLAFDHPVANRGYIERWASELGVSDLWRALVKPG